MSAVRPMLAAPRSPSTALEAVKNATGGFDVDAFHVMDERDNALIADEILNGAGSSKFVYDFKIAGGGNVSGITVIGARHLAAHYGALKHRLVASVQKTGRLFQFTSFPAEGMPMSVSCAVIPDLEDEPDFYGAVVEIQDVKTGNSIQIERRENRFEKKSGGGEFERQHYATIAQSKAYRNAILALIPQDVQLRWKEQMLKLGKNETITGSVIEEKRSGILKFATKNALPVDRQALGDLGMDQISGLSEAAKENVGAFVNAAKALGILTEQGDPETGELPPKTAQIEHKQKVPAPDKKAEPAKAEAAKDGTAADALATQQQGQSEPDGRPAPPRLFSDE